MQCDPGIPMQVMDPCTAHWFVTTLTSCYCDVNSRTASSMLQSNVPGMCTRMYLIEILGFITYIAAHHHGVRWFGITFGKRSCCPSIFTVNGCCQKELEFILQNLSTDIHTDRHLNTCHSSQNLFLC